MRKTIGILFIYLAATLIMLSILFLFNILRFNYPYTIAAFGFLMYIVGLFLTREGKFSAYKIAMITIAVLLIFVAIVKEFLQ